jgi:hypothetical protein
MNDFQWGDPPPPHPRKGGKNTKAWREEADQLRIYPGKWARVADRQNASVAKAMASQIRLGILAAFQPIGHFEATHRGQYVYARYVPPLIRTPIEE